MSAWTFIKRHPLRAFGRSLVLFLRYLMAVFYVMAGINKIFRQPWLYSDFLQRAFLSRLEEIDPLSFGAQFIERFALPLWLPIAWIVTWGELVVGLGLLLGWYTRLSAAGGLAFIALFAIGGYYDASLIVLGLCFVPVIAFKTGLWVGRDRRRYAAGQRGFWVG